VDENLIRRAIARDPGAMEALYDTYAPSLLSVCYRYCGNRNDAEDILHDGFIKIIHNIGTFKIRTDGSLEAWMMRIMVNTSLNFIRSRLKEKNFVDIDPILDKIEIQQDEEFGEEIYMQLSQDQVMGLIGSLPDGYRTVFNLYIFEKYGHKEIAGLMGCTENTSKSQLSKARALLRKKMNELVRVKTTKAYEKV